MEQNSARLNYLMQAYAERRITRQELDELLELTQLEQRGEIDEKLMQIRWHNMVTDENEEIEHQRIFENITADRRYLETTGTIRIHRWKKLFAYAAAVLVLFGIGITIHITQKYKEQSILASALSKNNIQPGGKKAVLTLSDGSTVSLEMASIGKLSFADNLEIGHKPGQLSYHEVGANHENVINTVTTPKGGEYELILQDGTKVWLNAGSKITYPVVFNGNDRRVFISGEAYFEVAKNPKKPFIVEADGTQVRVLGTHFNVSAYKDDGFVKTTLIEGGVKVSYQGKSALLKPNQESISGKSANGITLADVDTEQALAWKNGYFMFKNEDIHSVMTKVARWYDLELFYQGDFKGKTFGGTLSRFGNIKDLLKTIELTQDVHFSIQGRRVTVMP